MSGMASFARRTVYAARETSHVTGARQVSSASASTRHAVEIPPPAKPRNNARRLRGEGRGVGWAEDKDALAPLRFALLGKDSHASWKQWSILCEMGKQRSLTSEDHRRLMLLIQQDTEKLANLALHHAQNHNLSSLTECLKILVMAGKYDSVLAAASASLTALQQDPARLARSVQLGRLLSHVVGYAAIACANQTEPSVVPLIALVRPLPMHRVELAGVRDASTMQAANGTPLSPDRAVEVFREVSLSPVSAKVPLDYFRHAMLAWGLDHKSASARGNGNPLARRIGALFSSNNFDAVQVLLSTAMEAKTDAFGRWLSMSAYYDTGADWNDMTWSALLSGSLIAKRRQLAAQAWGCYSSLKPESEPPTSRIWNALLEGYAECHEWEAMAKTWQQMKAGKQLPDSHAYTTMIAAYFRARLPSDAMLLFAELKDHAGKGRLVMTPTSASAVLHGLLFNDRRQEALEFYSMMCHGQAGIPKPNITALNTMLRLYGRHGDFPKIVETLKSVVEFDLEPDVVTCTTVLDAFSRAKDEDAVGKVYDLMQKIGIKPSAITLTALIRSALERDEHASNPPDFTHALGLLHKMEMQGPHPTAVSYATLISALLYHCDEFARLYRAGRLLKPYAAKMVTQDADEQLLLQHRPEARLALVFMDQMRTSGPAPSRATYHSAIAGLLATRNEDESEGIRRANRICLQRAMTLLDGLCEQPGANADTWAMVLRRLLEHRDCSDPARAEAARTLLTQTVARVRQSDVAIVGALERVMVAAASN